MIFNVKIVHNIEIIKITKLAKLHGRNLGSDCPKIFSRNSVKIIFHLPCKIYA